MGFKPRGKKLAPNFRGALLTEIGIRNTEHLRQRIWREKIRRLRAKETEHGEIQEDPLWQNLFKERLQLFLVRGEKFIPEFRAILETIRVQHEEADISPPELNI